MKILVKQFLIYVERCFSYKTLENYSHYMAHFVEFMDGSETVDLAVIDKYYEWLEKKGLSVCTIHYHMATLRTYARWCDKYNYPFVKAHHIPLPKFPKKKAVFLTTQEVHTLLDSLPTNTLLNLRNRALIEFIYSTGLRIGEVYRLNRKDINLRTHEFSIIGKGNRTRVVFLSDRAEYWMGKYLDARSDKSEALFVGFSRNSERLTAVQMENIVREKSRVLFDKKVTCHTLRHSFATNLLENGADIKAVQELLGHENIQTTSLYLHCTNERLRHIHQVCHS